MTYRHPITGEAKTAYEWCCDFATSGLTVDEQIAAFDLLDETALDESLAALESMIVDMRGAA